ncbi:MAG: ribonucleotide-diphosphate reductase, partial [Calditrichaeota bacterium]
TSFLWEEAKHVEVFRRFLDEVAGVQEDLNHYHTESYRQIFYEALPGAMSRLLIEPSPVAQAEASVTYNMIVEGVLAETGYYGFYNTLERNHILPGLLQVTGKLKQDESRHIAYGVYLLSRLVAEHGQPVWLAIESRMNALLEPALGVINEIFAAYPEMPFGLDLDEFLNFALNQFQKRMDRIERAKSQTLQEVETIALEAL